MGCSTAPRSTITKRIFNTSPLWTTTKYEGALTCLESDGSIGVIPIIDGLILEKYTAEIYTLKTSTGQIIMRGTCWLYKTNNNGSLVRVTDEVRVK